MGYWNRMYKVGSYNAAKKEYVYYCIVNDICGALCSFSDLCAFYISQ